jgi:ornithine cyclodeaminase/alanine dehydrogenase-like protein (mu-crystallin family)
MARPSAVSAADRANAARATLVLGRDEIAALLTMDACIAAVERALALHAAGRSLPPALLSVHAPDGSFHVKAAGLLLDRSYFVAKTNANFPDNPARFGLPTIQGVVVLCDAHDGRPLAVMESGLITSMRTAAATAVAARRLARPDARVATIIGCGVQGRAQLHALAAVLPLERVYAVDRDPEIAARYAVEMHAALALSVVAAADPGDAARASDVCATCTTATGPLLGPGDVPPGAFVAAVGADNPHKQELDPRLLASATLVVDSRAQAAAIGELHHAIDAGCLPHDATPAELAEVVAGLRPGRSAPDEVVVFDSTGIALEDVAAAAAVYEGALARGVGTAIRFGG